MTPCKCVEEYEAAALTSNTIAQKIPGTVESVRIMEVNILGNRTYSDLEILYFSRSKKDGANLLKKKIKIISVSHIFCPFCGQKYE